eukprot:GHVH01003790.1.p1 GENE.GHVH01003790.1~~GHVH01003790.1.p1  ORF type:complete len:522 (-),score=78.61 GHVH01003790.1:326-1891(-)
MRTTTPAPTIPRQLIIDEPVAVPHYPDLEPIILGRTYPMVAIRMDSNEALYVPARQISSGTYGLVFKGWDPEYRRWIVVKELMLPSMTSAQPSIIREVDILQQLSSSPYIIHLYDVIPGFSNTKNFQVARSFGPCHRDKVWWTNESHSIMDFRAKNIDHLEKLFLSFEPMDGDLSDVMKSTVADFTHNIPGKSEVGPAPRDKKLFSLYNIKIIMYQALKALEALHEIDCVHRDIKPQNLLFRRVQDSSELVIKLADFGLARRSHHVGTWPEAQPSEIRTDVTHGVCTLWYRPPEIILRSETHDISLDVWGLGVVFYQMLFRAPPWGLIFNETEMIYKIFQLFGLPDNLLYQSFEGWHSVFPSILPKESVAVLIKLLDEHQSLLSDISAEDRLQLAEFLGPMFQLDPSLRPTPSQQIDHPFLVEIRRRFEWMATNHPDLHPVEDFTNQMMVEFNQQEQREQGKLQLEVHLKRRYACQENGGDSFDLSAPTSGSDSSIGEEFQKMLAAELLLDEDEMREWCRG